MQAQAPSMTKASVWNLDVEGYRPHELHRENRNFIESNCYIDIWVELIHALDMEVYPFLAFTLASDFEDDQWTFYKPSFDDLQTLYGISVQEMYLWGPLHHQIAKQLHHNKIVLLEADSFYLPDTQETDYKANHVKTTIAIESIDLDAKTMSYFHNAGYYALGNDDFDGIFHLAKPPIDGYLPPLSEIVKLNSLKRLTQAEYLAHAKALAKHYVALLPEVNPIRRFKDSFNAEMEGLCEEGLEVYHQYAFGSLRQLGSCFEFSAYFLRRLQASDRQNHLDHVAAHFDQISSVAKALIMKGARMVNRKTLKDVSGDFDNMAQQWDAAMDALRDEFA